MLLKLQDVGEQPCKKYEGRFRKLMGIQIYFEENKHGAYV